MPSPKEKRRVSFGSVTTFGNPSNANFGGSGFGTPKYTSLYNSDFRDEPKSKSRREEDDLPPSASIYDTGRSSPFPRQTENTRSPSPQPETPSMFTSPPTSTPKRTDPTPVIIFGFPSSHSLLIIREYERYGPILEHFSSTHTTLPSSIPAPPREIVHGGNWIRITYADAVSAARAVATNGQLIGGAYMIGVVYAPKSANDTPATEEIETPRRDEVRSAPTGGERKMNVVRGGGMFVKRDEKVHVGWGTWAWNTLIAGEKKAENVSVVGTQGQSTVVKAIKGLSEHVFGF
jgi:hypothetical protein